MESVPQGHYGGRKGDESDGIQIREMRKEKMNGGEDQDEVRKLHFSAIRTNTVVEFLE